jgi:hypothetical protein
LGAVAGTPALTAPLSFSDPRLTRLVPRWAFLVLLLAAELVALTPPFDAGKALKDRSGIVGLVVGLEGFLRSAFITGAAAIAFLSWDAARDEFIRVFHDPDLTNYDQRRHSLVREILPCQPPMCSGNSVVEEKLPRIGPPPADRDCVRLDSFNSAAECRDNGYRTQELYEADADKERAAQKRLWVCISSDELCCGERRHSPA